MKLIDTRSLQKASRSLFKFLASVKLAIILLVFLVIVFAASTFVESFYGTEAAQIAVYRTWWFSLFLGVLAFNLITSVVNRFPLQKKHTGFAITHLGIILILIGSLISKTFGIEGELMLEEGVTGHQMTIFMKPMIQIMSLESNQIWTFPVQARALPWSGRQELKSKPRTPFRLHLLHYYQKALAEEKVLMAKTGSPALHMMFKGAAASFGQWFFLNDPRRNRIDLGPASIQFSYDAITPRKKGNLSEWGVIHFYFADGKHLRVLLDQLSVGQSLPIKGTPFHVKVEQILKDAVVEEAYLVEGSGEWQNPALMLSLKTDTFSEQHVVFARFPGFRTLQSAGLSKARVQINYEVPGVVSDVGENELRFTYNPDGFPTYEIKKANKIQGSNVVLGEWVETDWMDFKFSVDQYLNHATIEQIVTPLSPESSRQDALPLIQIELQDGQAIKKRWLTYGQLNEITLGGSHYHIAYNLQAFPLGFQLQLNDFIVETDPGTNRPASFRSNVTLKDVARGIDREQVISMNHPLKHRGFKVFQAGYELSPGKPEISIFSIARDPGNVIKYAGTIIMVAGILMLFYVKQFSTLKSSDPKMKKGDQ